MYEWDEAKRRANLAKHGVDFADMARFDWDTAVFLETWTIDNEQRETVLGLIGGSIVVAVLTERYEITRVISLRRANNRERMIWNNA